MKQDVNNIDNLFREGLGGYTEVPPPDVWDALERRLDNDKKKRPFAWRWFFVMLCGIGLFGSLFAWKMNGHSGVKPDVADASGIASIQQKSAAIQTSTPGNTSAGSEKSTVINSHKHKNELKNTNSNNNTLESSTVSDPSITANSIDYNVAATTTKDKRGSILDNTAVAMANVEPEMQSRNNSPVRYVVNNKSHNNIVVAESEPANITNNYNLADESEEDNVTFGRKPKVNIDEPAPRNTYAANTRYEGVAVTGSDHEEQRATNNSKSIRTKGIKSGKVNNKAANSDQIAVSTPHKKQGRSTNRDHQNNPYSITNDNSSINSATSVASATEKRDKRVATDNTNNSITKKDGIKVIDNGAGNKTIQTGVVKNKKHEEQVSKNPVTITATKKTEVVGSSISAVTKTPANKGTTTRKTSNKNHLPASANKKQKGELVNQVAAATTTEIHANTTHVNVPHKNVVKKTDGAVNISQLASGKNAKVNTDVSSTLLVPTREKVAKSVTKNEGKIITNKVAATKPEANRKSSATTATKKNKKEQPRSEEKIAAHQSDDAIKLRTENAVKNKKKSEKTRPTAATTIIVSAKQKKDKKTTGKTETNNTLGAAVAAIKEPGQTVAVQVKTTPVPETQKVMSTFKEVPKPSIKPTDTAPLPVPAAATAGIDSPAAKQKFGGFTYGIKAGYEGGFTHDASNKLVISPFIERRLSSKFSIMAQPAIKSSRARSNGLSGTQTFYKTDPNGTVTNVDSFLIPVIQNNQTTGYLLRINVAYHETHDSIVKSYATGGNYLEFELPILLKYSINDKLSVYGGVSLNYSKYIQIKENTFTAQAIVRNDTTFTIYPTAPAPISSVLQYAGNNISSYSGPLYPAQSGGLFRMGYMLGVSYEIRKRWLIDAMLQKAPAKTNIQGGYDVNKGLSTSYFRLTLGYRLSK